MTASLGELSGAGLRSASPRRPLILVLAAYCAGLLLSDVVAMPPGVAIACAGLLLLAAIALRARRAATGVLLLGLAATGLATARLETVPVSETHVSARIARGGEFVDVRLLLRDDPVRLTMRSGDAAYRVPVSFLGIRRAGEWAATTGRGDLVVRGADSAQDLRYGDEIVLSALVRVGAGREGGPPTASMDADGETPRIQARDRGNPLRAACLAARRHAAELLGAGIESSPDAAGMMRAFMLGYREELPERAHRVFSRTGTLHIAAISGAHVGILAMILLVPLKATGLAKTRWVWVLGPILVLYAMSTGLAASAVRACIMATVILAAHALRRRPDGLSALAFAALLILVAEPAQLWEAGFLLSFVVVAGLILYAPPLAAPLLSRLQGDAWAPRESRGLPALVKGAARYMVGVATVTVAAWFASAPLTAHFFHLVSPVGLLSNLLIVPLAALVLLSGCLSIGAGLISIWAASVFNAANVVLVELLIGIAGFFDRLPFAYTFVREPPLILSVAWYAAMLALLARSRRLRLAVIAVAVLVTVLIGIRVATDSRTVIAVRSSGDQLSVLVDAPGGGTMLLDPGPSFSSRGLVRWLRSEGVDRLDRVVLTRSSAAVAGALPDLVAEIPVREILKPSDSRSRVFDVIARQVESAGIAARVAEIGTSLGLDARGMQVLHESESGDLAVHVARGVSSAWIAGRARDGAWAPAMPRVELAIIGSTDSATSAGWDAVLGDGARVVVFPGESVVRSRHAIPDAHGRANGSEAVRLFAGETLRVRFAPDPGWAGARSIDVGSVEAPR